MKILKYYFVKLRLFLFQLLLMFITAELVLWLIITFDLFSLKISLPTYNNQNHTFWYDLNQDFGVMHLPNDSFRQIKRCFDVQYHANEYGFRDVNRPLNSNKKRVLVLGDSFIEGYGVEIEDRLTNRLEQKTDIPHLNFGMSGNFGSTQQFLLYEKLASKFSHDAVIMGVLPANDFVEDDIAYGRKYMSDRYRPYLVEDSGTFQIKYFQKSLSNSTVHPASEEQNNLKRKVKRFLRNFTYTYNFVAYVHRYLEQATLPVLMEEDYIKSPSYVHYEVKNMNRLKYAIKNIKLHAGDIHMTVLIFPSLFELAIYKPSMSKQWAVDLGRYCESLGVNYLDLFPVFNQLSAAELQAYYLACDGHWTAEGNEFVADYLLKAGVHPYDTNTYSLLIKN